MLKNGEIKIGDFDEECIRPVTKSSILTFRMSACASVKLMWNLSIQQASKSYRWSFISLCTRDSTP